MRLIVKHKAEVIQEYNLARFSDQIDIGSDKANDIVIEDQKISQTHLAIEKKEDGYYVKDKGSDFGTYLNGEKIEKRTRIKNSDAIRIGEHDLVFEGENRNVGDEKNSEAETVILDTELDEKTRIAGVSRDDKTVVLEEQKSFVGEKTRIIEAGRVYYLLAIYGPYKGKCYRLNADEIRIGRDSQLNDIVLDLDKKGKPDTSISRRHATISVKGGKFYLSDKRSKTRTYYNTKRLSEEDIVELKEKDEIEIVSDKLSTIFRFVREDNWDFSPPKKAGVWWVRYRSIMINILSAVLGMMFLFYFFSSFGRYEAITQKPGKLEVSTRLWLKGEKIQEGGEIKDENGVLFGSSPVLCKMGNKKIGVILLDGEGNILGFDGKTRKPLWPNIEASAVLPSSPVLEDFDGDGREEIVVSSQDSRIYIYGTQLGILKYKSELLGGQLASSPSVGDVNGDGLNDLVVCSQDGWLYIGLNLQGGFSWERHYFNFPVKSTPSLSDLDGDGRDEILIGTENGKLLIFSINKEPVVVNVNESLRKLKGTYAESHSIRTPVSVSPITSHSKAIILLTRQLNALVLDSRDFSVLGYAEYPNPGFQYPVFYPAPLAADFNRDGRLDFLVAAPSGAITAYAHRMGKDKGSLWSYQCMEGEIITTTPALCDFSKDGVPDVVVSGSSGTLYILNGENGRSLFKKTYRNRSFVSSPVIGDINGDGWIDIVLQCVNRDILILSTNMKLFKNSVIWDQPLGSGKHTGVFLKTLPNSSNDLLGALSSLLIVLFLIFFHLHQRSVQRNMAKSIIKQ